MSVGARNADVAFTLSMVGNRSPAEIVAAVPDGLNFFGLQFMKESSVTLRLVRLAEKYGFKALVITVDGPVYISRVLSVEETLVYDREELYALLFF